MNKNNIIELFKNFNAHTDDYLGAMYMSIFNEFPQCYRIYYKGDGELTYTKSIESFQLARKEITNKIDSRQFLKNIIDIKDKHGLKVFCYSAHEYIILGDKTFNVHYGGHDWRDDDHPYRDFMMIITLSEEASMCSYYEEVFCEEKSIDKVFALIKDCFAVSHKQNDVEFGIGAVDAANNLYTSWYQYSKKEINIEDNYNDDFPYEKLCDLIENEDSSELILFYGEPGTGKTSVIKHLISKYDEMDFVFIDGGILAGVSQEKLMSYFLDNQNTIFILEDCEKALVDREHNFNPVMPVLLNITDGIIGDVLGIKLICTFNTALSKIDQALLRKGRLSLKYEFKKLAKEKCRKITGDMSIDKDMTLADLYNKDEENDFSKKNQKKIGF